MSKVHIVRKKTLSGKTGKLQENPLVEKIRSGDRDAFDQFIIQYRNRVYYTALRLLNSHGEALDATQKVFLKVWLKARSIRKGEKITSFQDESDKKIHAPDRRIGLASKMLQGSSSNSGKARDKAGMKVINSRAATSAAISGQTAREISPRPVLETPHATKRFTPTGGVI